SQNSFDTCLHAREHVATGGGNPGVKCERSSPVHSHLGVCHMYRWSTLLGLGVLALALVVGVGTSGETKKDKDKTKGTLPAGWKALNLTPEQKTSAYKIIGDYKAKIKDLQDKISDLQAKEKAELFKVLTAEQKETLVKITTGEVAKDKAPPKDGSK